MPITFGEARKVLARYSGVGGKCADSEDVALFVRQVLEYMLFSGHYGNLRKFTFFACKGMFTAPPELEEPLKVRIDTKIGTVWDKWYEWHATKEWQEDCIPVGEALFEEPNLFPTAYDIPDFGTRVGTYGLCLEKEDAHVIVKGIDPFNKEIITVHKGEQVVGEYLSIKKGQIIYSQSTFKEITAVVKTITNGYVQLLWVNPVSDLKGFLSNYSPLEEKPAYRRFKLTTRYCPKGNSHKIEVLGRIKLKEKYADNDYIPFDNIYTLHLAGQSINANFNNDVATSDYKDKKMVDIITRENEYRRVNTGQPLEVYHPTSGGSITNIIGGKLW